MSCARPPDALPRHARWRGVSLALVFAGLGGCAVGPDYQRPATEVPAAFSEAVMDPAQWKVAEPRTVEAGLDWWKLFGDRRLDQLVDQANASNQTLQQAQAQYRQARSLVQQARSAFFPTVSANVGTGRQRTTTLGVSSIGPYYTAALDASWEPDLWGLVRRQAEAASDSAQASAAQLAATRLLIQAEVAQDYIQLRITDVQIELYARTIAGYQESLKLSQSQFRAGIVTQADVSLATVTLTAAQAQATDLVLQRKQLEHALAVLVGRPPSGFSIPSEPFTMTALVIPPGLPSTLLERRPDIASAERQAAAANANIGVARAAYFPQLLLNAALGSNSASLANWFTPPARVWSLGAALAQTLFDGGLRSARSDQALAAYDAAVANYKQTVLAALQDVEDNLASLAVLDREVVQQEQAVKAAQDAERVTLAQYRGGTATYLSVITAQTLALSNQRTAIQLRGRQLAASVGLIKAVGGGWHADALSAAPAASAASAASTASAKETLAGTATPPSAHP